MPGIAALILAAGTSRRMQGPNKLLREVGGMPMIERAVWAAVGSRCSQVVVVTGWQADLVQAAVRAEPAFAGVQIVHNPQYSQGLATSIRCAVAVVADRPEAGERVNVADAALVQLADMPWVAATHLDRLIEAFDPAAPSIVAPVRNGRRGNPVLWPRRHFAALAALQGDAGARELLLQLVSEVRTVPFDTDAIFQDIDTREQLEAARESARPPR